jgi:selenocysteine lyase/cysteine desulfurase
MIKAKHINTEYLKEIFLGNSESALNLLAKLWNEKDKMWLNDFEHDALLAFWLAIHKEDLIIAQNIINRDFGFRQIATLAMHRKNEKPKNYDQKKKKRDKA